MEKEQARELSKEELLEKQYKKKARDLRISQIRASVLRKQITEAYEILENIRFDHLCDTAFRDKIVSAKRGLEFSIGDFLLDDQYWQGRIKKISQKSPKEYDDYINHPKQIGDSN